MSEEDMPLFPLKPHCFDNFTSSTDSSLDMSSNSCMSSAALEVKVKQCSKIMGTESHDNDIYRNCSIPRGYVFIANFSKFPDSPYETRPGSSIDVYNLSELFIQMGYLIVGPYDNLTKFELIKAMEAFRDDEAFSKVDSCVVAIMSHGKGEKFFLTSDNKTFSYHEVLEMFNNQQAPLLLGKPKVFIFQSCRGPMSDSGVGQVPSFMPSPRPVPQRDGVALGHTGIITSTPSFTDMYIIYSSIPGFVSYRCPDHGSWLIENICLEFMEHSWNKDLESLMKLVSRRLKSLSSDKGKKQSCETRNIGFDKHLFFNPQSRLCSMDDMMDALPTLPSHCVESPSTQSGTQNMKALPNPVSVCGSYSQGNAVGDVVDSPSGSFGLTGMEFQLPCEASYSSLKRQLSSSTNSEALKYCNALKGYLQVHDMPQLAACLKSVESELHDQKRRKKTRKPTDTQSQGF